MPSIRFASSCSDGCVCVATGGVAIMIAAATTMPVIIPFIELAPGDVAGRTFNRSHEYLQVPCAPQNQTYFSHTLTYQHNNEIPQDAYRVVGVLGRGLRSADTVVRAELLLDGRSTPATSCLCKWPVVCKTESSDTARQQRPALSFRNNLNVAGWTERCAGWPSGLSLAIMGGFGDPCRGFSMPWHPSFHPSHSANRHNARCGGAGASCVRDPAMIRLHGELFHAR